MSSENLYKPCKHCSKNILKNTKTIFGVGICLLMSFIVFSQEANASAINVEQEKSVISNNQSRRIVPEQEVKFINIISASMQKYKTVSNPIQKAEIREWRGSELKKVGAIRIENWVGYIKKIDVTSKGNAILIVEIGTEKIQIRTSKSEMGNSTYNNLIPKNSSVYNTIKTLKRGDAIEFSGVFILDNDDDNIFADSGNDFIKESSLTIDGSMLKPEFLFVFADVKLVN